MSKRNYIVAGVLVASIAMSGTAYAADTFTKGEAGSRIRGSRGAVEAQLLGITQEEFQARIENGEKPREMLDAAGVTREDMQTALRAQTKIRLAQAVANGKLTQAEADSRLRDMAAHDSKHQAIETALENNDYAAWVTAAANTPIAGKITETNFAQFAKAHALMEQGDRDGARAIMNQLGIAPRVGHIDHDRGERALRH